MARPRRFGKSLFLDTLGALFEGSEALFRGLAIHDKWDWSARYPVVCLSFGAGTFRKEGDLEAETADQLGVLEERAGLAPGSTSPSWTRWTHPRWPAPTATTCADSTPPSRNATAISASRS